MLTEASFTVNTPREFVVFFFPTLSHLTRHTLS
jgi:hypothetical protein